MPRRLLLALLLLAPALTAADKKDDKKDPGFVVRTGHIVGTHSKVGKEAYLLFTANDAFEKVFEGLPLGVGKNKANPVTKETFESEVVVAVVHRTNSNGTFSDVSVKADDDTLTVTYKYDAGKASKVPVNNALVLSVPKG